ncbi:MAG: hypothetical protein AVDCRST_MAG80-1361, partial [uncultured Rubrobacteraceae bacterium]
GGYADPPPALRCPRDVRASEGRGREDREQRGHLRRTGRRQGPHEPHRRGDDGQGSGLRHRGRLLRPRQHHPARLPGPPAPPPPPPRGGLLRAGGGADRARGPAQDRGPCRLLRG